MKAIAVSILLVTAAASSAPEETIVLGTARALDGRGGVLEDKDVVVRDGLIAEIAPRGSTSGERVYDLTAMTVLPGYIDTHVHISRHFDPDGKLHPPEDREDLGHITLYGAENAYRTLMRGVTIDLLFRNYAENAHRYDGIGDYTMEGFANLQSARPGALKAFQEALKVPGLKLAYSTDAVAGGHGRNAQKLVAYATLGGQDPMDVVISATSRAAESLGMADRIGAIAPGMEADIIALDGDPLSDPAALDRVSFVMRAGRVFKNEPRRAAAGR